MLLPLEDTFDFYANLPAYARFVNDELGSGLLWHFCQAIQGELDRAYAFLDNAPTYHDPDFAPKEWLPWLGQWVGLGAIGDHYLGIGINPDWPEARQRRLIKEATAYWQIKGTVPGIRKAIQLWLWEESEKSRLYFVFPFGRTPTHNPPNWWSYQTPYNAIALLPFKKRKEFGDSTYPGTRYLPHATPLLTQKGDGGSRYEIPYPEQPYDSQLLELEAHPSSFVENLHSRLGPNRPWLYFEEIPETEWNQIFPDIFKLEPEIFPAVVRPTFMGYLAPAGAEKTTLKLDQLVALPQEIRKHQLKLDGWHYYRAYQVPPKPGRTQGQSTSHREHFDGWPGRNWKHIYRVPYGMASGEREVIETTTVEIPPVKCTPGIKTRIPTGQNIASVVSPAVPSVTRLQLVEAAPITRDIPLRVKRGIYPGFTYKSRYVGTSRLSIKVPHYGAAATRRSPGIEPVSLQGISFRFSSTQNYVTGVPRVNLRSAQAPEEPRLGINLSGIANLAVKLPSDATWSVQPQLVDYDSSDPRVLLGRKSYYCPSQVTGAREEIIKRGGKVIAGNTVARYDIPYFRHAGYYRHFPGKPEVIQVVPEYKEIALCNVPFRWTTPKVETVRTRTEILESSLPLQQKYPQLTQISDSRNWVCSLFTTSGVVVIRNPTVFYWQSPGGRHKSFSFDPKKYPELYLEFVFTLSQGKKATARSLVCGDRVIEYTTLLETLNFPQSGVYGFKFVLPLEFVEAIKASKPVGQT